MNLAPEQYLFVGSILVSLHPTLCHFSFLGNSIIDHISSSKSGLYRRCNQVLKNVSHNDAIFCTGDSNSSLSSSLFIVRSCSVNQPELSKGK